MSNFINPLLVEGYVDEQDTESAQGCYIGADPLWEGEIAAEKAIHAQHKKWAYIRKLKQSIENLKSKLAKCSEYNYKKREKLEHDINKLENELKQIK